MGLGRSDGRGPRTRIVGIGVGWDRAWRGRAGVVARFDVSVEKATAGSAVGDVPASAERLGSATTMRGLVACPAPSADGSPQPARPPATARMPAAQAHLRSRVLQLGGRRPELRVIEVNGIAV
jgi:hypothetical protein